MPCHANPVPNNNGIFFQARMCLLEHSSIPFLLYFLLLLKLILPKNNKQNDTAVLSIYPYSRVDDSVSMMCNQNCWRSKSPVNPPFRRTEAIRSRCTGMSSAV